MVFTESICGTIRVFARRYVVGSGWDAIAPLENNTGFDADGPKAAVNATGAAAVVWRQRDGGGNWRMYSNVYTETP